jgi:competence protein ComEC
MSRHLRTLAALLGVLLASGCESSKSAPAPAPGPPPAATTTPRRFFGQAPDGKLHVYFFDVGQGDATLIISPTGYTVLVDAGPTSAGTHLTHRLPELLTGALDLVILTHPHPDHHGGLAAVVQAVGARKLLEPQLPGTSSEYDALLTALGGGEVEIFSPAPSPSAPAEPLRLPLGGGAELAVLWPRAPTEPLLEGEPTQELNSIVLRLAYGDTSVLLAGDAREQTERHLLARQARLDATLLKVGAHGAGVASSADFLRAVQPQAAIISTGGRHARGGPAQAVLSRLEAVGARVFRTDRDGEVRAESDGQRFSLSPQQLPENVPEDTAYVYPGTAPVKASASRPDAPERGTKPAVERSRPGKAAELPRAPSGSRVDIDLDQDTPSTTRASRSRPSPVEKGGGIRYVASRKGKNIFHLPDCRNAKRIHKENLIVFHSREEAARDGRVPARDCNP